MKKYTTLLVIVQGVFQAMNSLSAWKFFAIWLAVMAWVLNLGSVIQHFITK
ncbi:hypothetical protein JGUZn3_19780 [Entomobacter blattae]|uniref:Uncharacterized protein n=1 Tax=Entomobacter blattae TaxID=2762277 RepID=A0A7H1NTS3_9PROT|nr:hypothetical protein JGUZn3_19780 [Entomobacter blattae]